MSNPDSVFREALPLYFDHDSTFHDLPLQEWPEQLVPGADARALHLAASNGALVHSQPSRYHLGEANLPVAAYRQYFLGTVENNQKVIVTAETGTGKSSNLGLYLLEAGAPIVYVTQPRVLAARKLMERARYNLGDKHAHLAGYLTRDAADSDCPEGARLIYITEDKLFKMANRGLLPPDAVVIDDEAHEKGVGTIMLLGLMKKLLRENPEMRLIVSSATIDENKFSTYLDNAPVLNLPGRTHPITQEETSETVAQAMRRLMKRPHSMNVLAFEPSTTRMRRTRDTAARSLSDHTVSTLYGDQSPLEQTEALNPADGHHVVATRVAETSITPENKDAVVDSGYSNLGGYEEGVRTLSTVISSKATMHQRMGRVGRTRPGYYVVAQAEDAPPTPSFESRPDYDPSAIENSSVASYILELNRTGRRLEDLDLLEHPTEENLRYDQRLLRRLGAIPLGDNAGITEVGVAMTNLCLDPPEARMVVEARKYTQVEDGVYSDAVRLQVAAGVAVQQVKGMLDTGPGTKNRYMGNGYLRPLSMEQTSDFLFQIDVFTDLLAKQRAIYAKGAPDAEKQFDNELRKYDILPNRYYKALRVFEELCRREEIDPLTLSKPTKPEREQIIACQITGMEELFVQRGKRVYTDIRGDRGRMLGKHTTIDNAMGNLVAGTAFNFQGITKNGRFERRMVAGGSIVSIEQLRRNAPNRVSELSLGYGVGRRGRLVERQALFFDDELRFADIEGELQPTIEARKALIRAMMTGSAPDMRKPSQLVPFDAGTPNAKYALKKWQYAQTIEERSSVKLNINGRYESLINKAIRASMELDSEGNMRVPLDVTDPAVLDEIIPKVYVYSLVKPSRRRRTLPNIVMTSPDGMSIHTGPDDKDYVDVHYKNNIAYVSIPRDYKFTIRRSDFDVLVEHHDVKIRIANGKYTQLDAIFERIDSEREANMRRRQQRAERIAEMALASARNRQKTDRKLQNERERSEKERARRTLHLAARAKVVGSYRKAKRLARYALEIE